jgi:Zn-dependent protease
MIEIRCPKCQSLLVVEEALKDSALVCPDCESRFRVPPSAYDEYHRTEPTTPPGRLSISPEDAAVLGELEQIQNQQPSWGGAFFILVISLVLYMGAAQTEDIGTSIFILVAVIAFHETGHYLAMRLFGYRNLRMFFLPFFGAAVTGQHYNIAGWKKAVVALAGPVPGILLGVPLGAAGLAMREPELVKAAMLMLSLNGFNLLPFLPLDGGWVVHTILFVRHPVLELISRIVAGLCMLGLAWLMQAWCLLAVALFALLAAPTMYRLSRIAYRLGHEGLVTRSPDDQSIPTESALAILAELRAALPAQTHPKVLAQHVVNVFETFNADPPGTLASAALLTIYVGSFILTLVVFAVLQQPG